MPTPLPNAPVHVVGMFGTKLDRGGKERWTRWRPSLDLCRQPDLQVGRFDLICQPSDEGAATFLAQDIRQISPQTEVVLHAIHMGDPWDLEEVYETLFELAQHLPFDGEHTDLLVHMTTGTHIAQICWFLLVEAGVLPGRLLQTSPPRNRAEHTDHGWGLPPGNWDIIDLDLARYDRIARRFELARAEHLSVLKGGIATADPAFNQLITQIERIAVDSAEPVLLQGPTGAGKTRLARRIHALKTERQRLQGPLVEVDCTTLRGDHAMSTLFGHVRGAFTGAETDRKGLLRQADGGVLFLDEIGDLGLDEQAMLLRALEDGAFYPMGADTLVTSNFQLIAGTHANLHSRVAEGRFRQDLLARIDLWTFHLPGLAQRLPDLEPNLDHELARVSQQMGIVVALNAEARALFLQRATAPDAAWTGNFRDLRAAVTRMATLSDGGRIDVPVVKAELTRLFGRWQAHQPVAPSHLPTLLGADAANLDPFDRVQLDYVVDVCLRSASLADAGRALFSQSRLRRSTVNDSDRVRKVLARHGLTFDAIAALHSSP